MIVRNCTCHLGLNKALCKLRESRYSTANVGGQSTIALFEAAQKPSLTTAPDRITHG
jgi:hypothetical protein